MELVVIKKIINCSLLLPLFAAASATLLLTSCATTAQVEISDVAFTDTAIAAEKFAVGPVIQVGGEKISQTGAQMMRNDLRRIVGNKRDYIQMTSLGGIPEYIYSIGSTAERSLPSSVRSRARSNGVRYLLLTELTKNYTSNCIDKHCEDITEDICDCEGKVIGMRVIGTKYFTTSKSRRHAGARYKVLDLKFGKTVWVSRSDNSSSNSNCAESRCCYPPPLPYPCPPSVAQVVLHTSKAAVRKFPRKKFGNQY